MTGKSSTRIADSIKRAHEIRLNGLNCAETVVWAMGQYWNEDFKISYATGLGGGVARLGETCGALTGAIVALGAKVGRSDPADADKKALCYRLGQEVARQFKDEMGTTQCKDIIGFAPAGEETRARWTKAFQTGRCGEAIEAAIRALIRVVEG